MENAAELVIPDFAEETDHVAVLWGALTRASRRSVRVGLPERS